MKIKTFLKRFLAELEGLPQEEKSNLVEEISLHIDEGLSDPELGKTKEERMDKLLSEMGDPVELGRNLKDVHHSRRWTEFLMIVVPVIFLLPILNWIISYSFVDTGNDLTKISGYVFWSIRVSIFFRLFLVLISFLLYKKHGIITGLLYWLSSSGLAIFSLCFREDRWYLLNGINDTLGGMVESVFWIVLMLSLFIWLANLLIKRRDLMLVTFVLIPGLITFGNMVTSKLDLLGLLTEGYSLPNWRLIPNFGLYQVAQLIWPALFIFPKHRIFKWLALIVYSAPTVFMNLVASSNYAYLAMIWIIPLIMVLISGLFDITRKKETGLSQN